MQKRRVIGAVVGVAVAVVAGFAAVSKLYRPNTSGLEEFAQCLGEWGVTMYGADWCSHCQDQKAMFGSAFARVPYVECPDEPKLCQSKGIEGYPTWLFPDGRKLEGAQNVETLARESGCTLPAGETKQ